MEEPIAINAKYIYLDVVNFTQERSIEAQSHIIEVLNATVTASLVQHNISEEKRILIPTGDGICIVLLDIDEPYDIHLKIALKILEELYLYNESTTHVQRQFKVRIGINGNFDNLVTDINGQRNIAGAGINLAARVMSLAGGDQILVSQREYEVFRWREKYMDCFRPLQGVVKHDVQLPVFQFKGEDCPGLNVDIPELFKAQAEPKLNMQVAYYLAHAIKNRDSMLKHADKALKQLGATILLWSLAEDSITKLMATEFDRPIFITYGRGERDFEEQLEYYSDYDLHALIRFKALIYSHYLSKYDCFEGKFSECRFVSQKGMEKLKEEWPTIWAEFELDRYVGTGVL